MFLGIPKGSGIFMVGIQLLRFSSALQWCFVVFRLRGIRLSRFPSALQWCFVVFRLRGIRLMRFPPARHTTFEIYVCQAYSF